MHRCLCNNQQYTGNITGKPVTYLGTLTWEFTGMEYHADDVQMMQTDESQMAMSRTWESHKSITQINRTKQDGVMSKNGNDKQHFRMLQSNSGAYGGPETG